MRYGVGVIAFLLSAAASAHNDRSVPAVRPVDPKSLGDFVTFAQPDPRLQGLPGGELFWAIDVDLPAKAVVDRVDINGYAPVDLHLKDGRCFRIEMESGGSRLTSTAINPVCSPSEAAPPLAALEQRPGMRLVGRTWGMSAWEDKHGRTMLFLDREPQRPALLTTSIKVIAVGALGSPDTPATETTLVGYLGRQLTAVTVMLYYP